MASAKLPQMGYEYVTLDSTMSTRAGKTERFTSAILRL